MDALDMRELAELRTHVDNLNPTDNHVIVELVLLCHRIQKARTNLDAIKEWKESEFVKDLPSDYWSFYEKELAPAVSELINAYRVAYMRQTDTLISKIEELVGPLASLSKDVYSKNEQERAKLHELLQKLPDPDFEMEALRDDFPHWIDSAAELFGQYPERWRHVQNIRKMLKADDGKTFDEVWDCQDHPALNAMFKAREQYAEIQAVSPSYAAQKIWLDFEEFIADDGSRETDWQAVRYILLDAADYYLDSLDRLGANHKEGWVEQREAALEVACRFLNEADIWRFLHYGYGQSTDDWLDNLKDLRAIVVEEGRLNIDKRELLTEIYKSFVIGNYLSVFALMRAFIERVIRDKAKAHNVPILETRDGKSKEKSLDTLIDEVADKDTLVKKHIGWLDEIRRVGNDVLHEPKRVRRNDIESAKRLHGKRHDALRLIKQLSPFLAELGPQR